MQTLLNWQQHKTVWSIGFSNFYHSLIHWNFSTSTTPFISLLKYYLSIAQHTLALPFVCCRALLPVCVYASTIHRWMISVFSIIHMFIKTIFFNVHLLSRMVHSRKEGLCRHHCSVKLLGTLRMASC